MPNHYETLDLPIHATPTDVKKQFYRLSKAHHPDLHPNDPSKSKRFVAISEAYSILGSPEKRQRYDRDFLPAAVPASSHHPGHRGSYSSHSTPAGGRPASGLSKRRTQFKGPPPSFYQSGGWGAHSEKRAQYAAHGPEGTTDHQSGPSAPGTGPGGFAQGLDHDVPHFDQHGHHTRHEKIQRSRHHGRRRVERTVDDLDYSGGGSDPIVRFIMISGVLAIIFASTGMVAGANPKPVAKKKEGDNR
ncbi:hypothetical protein Q7P37_009085 [Cladosporium fusiforme]